MRTEAAVALAFCVVGCGASRYSKNGGAIAPLAVHPVDWNPSHADVGAIQAVADDGDDVVTFGPTIASFHAGALVDSYANPRAIRWIGATSITAPDGSGRWIVGVGASDAAGAPAYSTLFRVRSGSAKLESIADRYGFGPADEISSVADLGDGSVAFDGLNAATFQNTTTPRFAPFFAIADRSKVARLAYPLALGVVGGGGKAAMISGNSNEIVVADPAHGDRKFPLEARAVALDARGRLYAATSREVYAEDAAGDLRLAYEGESIHGLVATRDAAWFADGADLGSIAQAADGRTVVSVTAADTIARDAKIFPSSSGDVWALDPSGRLSRYASGAPKAADPQASWAAAIAPVFARACASCHAPNGPSGIDLSTFDAWRARTAKLRKRVVDDKTMPPKGHVIADADRAAIAAWLSTMP